ncbi:MAG: carbon storage regulator [Planctomycetes bacterium]|nr:carbon storage regulator [Planctomycetota bacterium]
MLVLTRRVKERLLIPCIQMAVQVLAARPTGVRLGIIAPPEVTVLREEVAPDPAARPAVDSPPVGEGSRLRHLLRNRLHNLSLGLAILRRLVPASRPEEVQAALDTMDREFADLRLHLADLLCAMTSDSGEAVASDVAQVG